MDFSRVLMSGFVLFFGLSCASAPSFQANYPSQWWEPVPREKGASWEVLPQEALEGQVILSKRNELGLLSNFAHTPFKVDGQFYESVEGFWQMMKFPEGEDDPRWAHRNWPYTRLEVSKMVGFEAKRAGKKADLILGKLGIKWVSYQKKRAFYKGIHQKVHLGWIRKAMIAKLQQNRKVSEVLQRTQGLVLLPDHHQKKDSPAAWRYYDIYMDLRTQIGKNGLERLKL